MRSALNRSELDSPGGSPGDGGVDHIVVVDPEHVHAAILHTDTQHE